MKVYGTALLTKRGRVTVAKTGGLTNRMGTERSLRWYRDIYTYLILFNSSIGPRRSVKEAAIKNAVMHMTLVTINLINV